MIYIIGTAHSKTQFWSDAIKQGDSLETCATTVERFETYLRGTAISLKAAIIAEESSEYAVNRFAGGLSVAKKVADEAGLHHIYCDPDPAERAALNAQTSEEREMIWMDRIIPFIPNETSLIFVCGACHSLTFKAELVRQKLNTEIYCLDWTKNEK